MIEWFAVGVGVGIGITRKVAPSHSPYLVAQSVMENWHWLLLLIIIIIMLFSSYSSYSCSFSRFLVLVALFHGITMWDQATWEEEEATDKNEHHGYWLQTKWSKNQMRLAIVSQISGRLADRWSLIGFTWKKPPPCCSLPYWWCWWWWLPSGIKIVVVLVATTMPTTMPTTTQPLELEVTPYLLPQKISPRLLVLSVESRDTIPMNAPRRLP